MLGRTPIKSVKFLLRKQRDKMENPLFQLCFPRNKSYNLLIQSQYDSEVTNKFFL